MELKGPGKYVKSIYKPYKIKPDINNVKMIDDKGIETIFLQNTIKISIKPNNKIYIYHSYDKENYSGRWYRFLDSNIFNTINNNIFYYDIENYENELNQSIGTHQFIIEFTDKGIKKLKKILNLQ